MGCSLNTDDCFFFPYKQWNVQQVAASNTEHLLCYIDSVEKYQHQPQTMVSRVIRWLFFILKKWIYLQAEIETTLTDIKSG